MAALTTVQSANSFATSLNMEFGFANSMTGVATGNALISGGVLDMTGASFKKVFYSDTFGNLPLGPKLAIDFDYKPAYSGTPSTRQNMFFTSQLLGIGNNQCYLYHNSGTGNLELFITNSSNVQVVYLQYAWNPTAGTWYKIGFFYDFSSLTAGIAGIYIDTARVANTTGVTYTRLPLNSIWQIGADGSDNASHVAEFSMRNWVKYNVPPNTGATRTSPTFPSLNILTQPIPAVGDVLSGVSYNYGLSTGTLSAATSITFASAKLNAPTTAAILKRSDS